MNANFIGRLASLTAIALTAVMTTGCATSASRVSVEVDTCCEAEFQRYETYQVTLQEVPGFLGPYLEGGLNTVLAQKGLRPTLDRPDLRVVILFEQIFLDENTEKADYFGESVAPINATRFMAAVKVDVFDAAENRIVWSGRLSRIHNDPTLQPRGNDHKMQGIIDGFGELFADYPIRLDDTQDAYGMN